MSTDLLQQEEAAMAQKALAHQMAQSGVTHEALGAQTGLSTSQVKDALNVTKSAQEAGHVYKVHSELKKSLKGAKTAAQVVTVTKEVKGLNKIAHKLTGAPSSGGKKAGLGDVAAMAAGGAALSGFTKTPRKKKKVAKKAQIPTSVNGLAAEVAESKLKSAATKSVKKSAEKTAIKAALKNPGAIAEAAGKALGG